MQVTSRKDRKYSILQYQPQWKDEFREIKKSIWSIFGDLAIRIEHVGSTAIEGMSGKPTIDVLVVVRSIEDVDTLNDKMKKTGYIALGSFVAENGRLFAKEKEGERLVNIHCFESGHPHAREMLVMRDYLQAHEQEVEGYAKLKLDLYQKYPDDYVAYRAVKDPYLAKLKQRALEWSEKSS